MLTLILSASAQFNEVDEGTRYVEKLYFEVVCFNGIADTVVADGHLHPHGLVVGLVPGRASRPVCVVHEETRDRGGHS